MCLRRRIPSTFSYPSFPWLDLVYTMKPAPFKPVMHTDETTKMVVHSDPNSEQTTVKDQTGTVLWSMNEYVGRRMIFLSPDGNTLLLFGNVYFGGLLSDDTNAAVLSIYEQGKNTQTFPFQAVFGMSIAEGKHRFNVTTMGGGWMAFLQYIHFEGIDWKTRTIFMRFSDQQKVELSF